MRTASRSAKRRSSSPAQRSPSFALSPPVWRTNRPDAVIEPILKAPLSSENCWSWRLTEHSNDTYSGRLSHEVRGRAPLAIRRIEHGRKADAAAVGSATPPPLYISAYSLLGGNI